jgi:predicted GNAT superfamily acetyltransferase
MIRDYRATDRAAVLAINEQNVPEVGPLDDTKLDLLIDEAVSFQVVEVAGAVVGLMILLGPGGTYTSPNYRWFSRRYDRFVYVDRIALTPEARGRGWGPALYARFEEVAREGGATHMLAEVNTVPINERSLRFHDRAGFDEVARCQPYGGDEEVAMLAKALA